MLSVFMWFVHFMSFGHNSLMDTAMGYDLRDPSKAHHPLVAGRVSLTAAHNVIHWGLCALSVLAVVISTTLSPNPLYAVICIFLWFVFGYAYNSGLSKESPLGFMSISICYAMMAAWAWFLSHPELTPLGWLYVAYAFTVILFQISFSGFLKELEVKEKSNILIKMGARLEKGNFKPGYSVAYGIGLKALGWWLLSQMIPGQLTFISTQVVWYISLVVSMAILVTLMCMPRPYDRGNELKKMSLMEIMSIYAPIPLLIEWETAAILMIFGVLYFYVVNLLLWKTPYPRV
jgi:4-hydroxybenzoate polyprenyltransferase